jgi:hypothetical protein
MLNTYQQHQFSHQFKRGLHQMRTSIALILSLGLTVSTFAEQSLAAESFPAYKPSSRSAEASDIRLNEYGYSATAPDALGIGDTAPDFELATPGGQIFSSRNARQQGPMAIVFYRGHW